MTKKILLPWYLPGKIKEGEGQDIEEAAKRFGIANGVSFGVKIAERGGRRALKSEKERIKRLKEFRG